MVKYSFLLLNFFGVFSFLHFSENGVRISDNTPTKMQAGQVQEITFDIDKGEIDLYAKLVLILPEGFNATKGNAGTAKFTTEGNKAKFTWSDIPDDDNISISYFLHADESLQGEYTIKGVFSYITENQRVDYDLQEKTIDIGIERIHTEIANQTDILNGELNCIRSIHKLNDSEYLVSLEVENSDIEDFVKIVESIPSGFEISNGEDGGSVTTISSNEMKFVWFEAPESSRFSVSYKLSRIEANASLNELEGNLVYNKDDNPFELVIHNDTPFTEDVVINIPDEEEIISTPVISIPDPEIGITYKVQIAAGRSEIIKNYFEKKYTFEEAFSIENHSGWMKYTTGSFEEYKIARDGRNRINSDYSFDGPFVTAYNEGVRITVQEALMISNQKWYQ